MVAVEEEAVEVVVCLVAEEEAAVVVTMEVAEEAAVVEAVKWMKQCK